MNFSHLDEFKWLHMPRDRILSNFWNMGMVDHDYASIVMDF